MLYYEDDFPAEKETAGKGSWLSCENEYSGRKKGFSFQESKRKSKIIRLMNEGHKQLWPFFLCVGNAEMIFAWDRGKDKRL